MTLVVWRCYRDDTWKDKKVYRDAYDRTRKILPHADHRVMTDRDIDQWMLQHFPPETREGRAYATINPKYGAARADLWRLLVVYVHGGLYLDMKSAVVAPIPPMDDMFNFSRWATWRSPDGKYEIQNWFVYAPARHPVLRVILDTVIQNVEDESAGTRDPEYFRMYRNAFGFETPAKLRVLFTTGPRAWTLAVDRMDPALRSMVREHRTDLGGSLAYSLRMFHHMTVEGKRHYSRQHEALCLGRPYSYPVRRARWRTPKGITIIIGMSLLGVIAIFVAVAVAVRHRRI